MAELFGKEQQPEPKKTLDELFQMLKEEAGEGASIILMRAKGGKGEDFRILTDGHMHSVLGLLQISAPYIQDLLQQKLDSLVKGATRSQ